MQVETYEEQEVEECSPDELADAMRLRDELGLEGQARFYAQDRTVVPYRKMTAQEAWVYGILLPQKTALKQYSDGPIPLRVIQIIAHVQASLRDAELFVWHPNNADIDDPILVAQIGPDWKCERFLLARWGASLEEWPILVKLAKTRMCEKISAGLRRAMAEISSKIDCIDAHVDAAYADGRVPSVSFAMY